MTNFYQTSRQNKDELLYILKKITLILQDDNSSAKLALIESINDFINKNRVNIADLEVLYRNLYEYQSQLDSNKISIHNAVQELVTPIKIFLRLSKAGYSRQNSNSYREHVFNGDYNEILAALPNSQTNVIANSYENILGGLFRVIDSTTDPTLEKIALDAYSANIDFSTLQTRIGAINEDYGNRIDQHLVTSSIYHAITNGKTLTDNPNALKLVDYIDAKLIDNGISFYTFRYSFQQNMIGYAQQILDQNFSIVIPCYILLTSLAGALSIDQEENYSLHNIFITLTLDMMSSSMNSSEVLMRILELCNSIHNIYNAKEFVAKIYASFENGNHASITGASDFLLEYFTSEITESQNTPHEAVVFASNLAQGSYASYGELASAIAAISSDISANTITKFTMDMAASNNPISKIEANLDYLLQDISNYKNFLEYCYNSNFLNFDIYHRLVIDLYTAFNLGEYFPNLSSSIEESLSLTSQPTNNFVSYIQSLSSNNNISSYEILAENIASLITPYSSTLKNYLQDDISSVGLKIEDIKNYLSHVNGESASQIAANMYFAWGGGFISATKGAQILASEIDYFNKEASDISNYFSLVSYIERKYDETDNFILAQSLANLIRGDISNSELINSLNLDFDSSNLSSRDIISLLSSLEANYAPNESKGAIITAQIYKGLRYPYDSAVQGKLDLAQAVYNYNQNDYIPTYRSITGNTPIAPQDKYLNICNKNNGVYTVAQSVFAEFDNNFEGTSLLKMPELFTISGRQSATSQCARYIKEYTGQELYLTRTQPAGVTGDRTETGCSESLSPAVFAAYCDSAFMYLDDVL